MRGMPPRGHPLGGAARVPNVRPRRLLRFFRRQARDAALSRNGAPGHALGDARGCLDLVLRPRVRGPPRPGLIRQLQRQFGREPSGARLAVRPMPHEAGTYYTVVVFYESATAEAYALRVESDSPGRWDAEARHELGLGE